ncbi:hypothetical protein [Pengzhenrongella frigida]|uniref:Uncharacterized protein n=1 Tax=Pengzhenrongella frigida TaxID=1259133 RepID=A0A4Q5N427_9MICO|nr:hypothetical protein [Cellulomonas sp. HLT2-17]RYV51397.1 hypothetical protein EUA98_08925 [Cellulomonas sp. HLT2-17]
MTSPATGRSGAPMLPTTFTTPDGAVAAARAARATAQAIPTQRARGRRALAAPLPLGSIATTQSRTLPGTTSCGVCASTALTHLEMTLTDGTPVVFVSCHACEHKSWFEVDGDGTAMSLQAVLGSATKITAKA